jgi:glucosamine--fructose-6-phosphate aminotransferase (isomerizing)
VIHNGIVENYQELKEELQKEGYSFLSETDTETIPNLIEHYMSQGESFMDATQKTVQRLEGYYAVLAMHEDEDKIIGTRHGSPLVVGLGENENFIASDIPAFLERTKQVQYIHDHDFVVIDENQVNFYDTYTGEKLNRPIHSVDWDLEQAEKGDFDHFMMKEIAEQVNTVKAAIN